MSALEQGKRENNGIGVERKEEWRNIEGPVRDKGE